MWRSPLALKLVPTEDSISFKFMQAGETGLPIAPHSGSFAFVRKNHIHEGIDLYCAEGADVYPVEPGKVVAIIPFTGPQIGTDWWNDTFAVLVEGKTGVVVYGEITPKADLQIGDSVDTNQTLGQVTRVLTVDKGRPMTMLHLELHTHGATDAPEWRVDGPRPVTLQDPTPHLMDCIPRL